MRRHIFVLALLGLVILSIPSSAAAAAPSELSPAAQSLSRCVQSGGRLSVLMLIDESGSLATTDPLNQRVDGIRAALTGLADVAETPIDGKRPEVSVLMAGFYGRVHPESPESLAPGAWRAVSHADVDQLLEEAGKYASLNHGKATDYATALGAAQKLFAARVAEQTEDGGAAPCQALLWFTDGRYSLPRRIGKAGVGLPRELFYAPGVQLDRPGEGEKAVALGKQYMCKPGGLMDELQADGVIRFTVALSTELSPEDGDFLDAATTGQGGSQRCGSSLSKRTGEYLSASDGNQLFFAFAGLTEPLPPVSARPVCPGLRCLRGVTTFETVPGVDRFLIRATGGAEKASDATHGLDVELRLPDGHSVTLQNGGPPEVSLDGTTITQRWVSAQAVEIEGDLSATSERGLGRWSYTFVDPGADSAAPPSRRSYSSVQMFTDIEPAQDGSPVLIRGSPTELAFQLTTGTNPARAVTSGPLFESAHLVATIEDPVAGTSTRVPVTTRRPDGTFSTTVRIPPNSTTGFVYLGLTASFSTPGGTPVAPQYRAFSVPVRLPPGQGFPNVSPPKLELPTLRGVGEATAQLTVRGSSVAGGCVWIDAPKVDAPEGAGKVSTSVDPAATANHCVHLAKGAVRHFSVRLTPSYQASGQVIASIPVHLRSDIVKTAQVVAVPLSFSMAPPRDVGRMIALLVALVLLGALLPLLLLYGLNKSGARFPAPGRLRVVDLPVEMSAGGSLRRLGEDAGSELGRGESLAGQGSRAVRELSLGSMELTAVAGGSIADRSFDLFRGPYGVARAGGNKLFAGASRPLRSWRDGISQEVPLGLDGTWIFRLDERRPAHAGTEPGPEAESPPQVPGAFFPTPTPTVRAPEAKAPREAAIEGRLVLLITDGPPIDQATVLFAAAEQELRSIDELWEEVPPAADPERPPPEDEAEPEPAEQPVAGEPESAGWQVSPTPRTKPKPGSGDGSEERFF